MAFQNCSGYAAETSPLYDNASVSTCIGLTCASDDTLIRLSITNDAAVYVKTGTPSGACVDESSCLDLAGYCDDGGYGNSYITATLYGGTVGFAEKPIGAKCVDGRYTAQIVLPTGYDYATTHTLRLKLTRLMQQEIRSRVRQTRITAK